MHLEVTPAVHENVEEALREALAAQRGVDLPADSAWRRAALAEGVERGDDYAFSPRSTRGATRA